MSCSNCYNGCPQITSDQCVKYTGIDVPVLGIKNGDSLSYVEQAIITFLTSTLDGTGVKPKIEQSIICNIVKKYLPTCGDLNVVDFLKALIQAVCELKPLVDGTIVDITTINTFIDELEANYDISDCLEDVTSTSGTHDVLQAVINKLCEFIRVAPDIFVKSDDIDVIIQNYLSELPGASKYYTKMVPFVAVPFFPTTAVLSNFSENGVGSGDWEKIYFCNGQSVNGYQTPDMRGRIPVGVTTGMGGSALSPIVAPGGLNPDYQLNTLTGANSIILSEPQMPTHNHTGSNIVVELSDPLHKHDILGITGGDNNDNNNTIRFAGGDKPNNEAGFHFTNTQACQPKATGITVSKQELTIVPEGGNEAHSNVQPGRGCFYIMYIP